MDVKSPAVEARSREAAKNLLVEMDKILEEWLKIAPDPPAPKKAAARKTAKKK